MPSVAAAPGKLGAREAHIWYAWTGAHDTPMLREYCRSLLSPAECARCDRFLFDHSKLEYLVTHALCRTVLSSYADVSPRDWRFNNNAYGRPEIVDEQAGNLRFNLSHARSLVACVVTQTADAGVDVEEIDRPRDPLDVAHNYFSALELRALRALPAHEQRRRFFQLWTLKESYIKARGMGLAIPLDHFSFLLQEPEIRIAFDPRLPDAPCNWQFQLFTASERHMMAVGIRRAAGVEFDISLSEVVLEGSGTGPLRHSLQSRVQSLDVLSKR